MAKSGTVDSGSKIITPGKGEPGKDQYPLQNQKQREAFEGQLSDFSKDI